MILNSLPSGVLVVDHHGKIALTNRQLDQSFGYEEDELLGQPLETLIPTPIRENHEALRQHYCESPEERRMGAGRDLYALRKNGQRFPVEVGLRPFLHHEQSYVVASVVDISDRRAIEAQAEEAYSDLQQLAYGVSHDLKAPMRGIAGFIQILKTTHGELLPPDAHTLIDRTVEAVASLQQHVNQLLNHAMAEARGTKFTDIPLDEILRNTLDLLEGSIENLDKIVTWGDLPTVFGDEVLLVQLFQNLVANAVKYSHPDRPPRIEVIAEASGQAVLVDVKDNGIGIQEEDSERIFQVFERIHGSMYPGSGIGLATCRRVARRLGGDIYLASSSEAGSVFRVKLRKGEISDG